jgi:hypothetical protein
MLRKLKVAILGPILISLLVLSVLGQSENINATHVRNTKFTLFDPRLVTEIKGIVAAVGPFDWIHIVPDPNYRHLAIEGNKITPPRVDCHVPRVVGFPPVMENRCYDPHPNFVRWQRMQDNVRQCNLPADLYPEPHPLIKLEKYGYDHIPDSPFEGIPPNLFGSNRPVQVCDHVRVLGYYVLDHGHAMYSGECIHGEKQSTPPVIMTCIPHAELHPYLVSSQTNTIEPVTELQPGGANIQRLSVFLPFYNRYYEYDDHHNTMGIGGRIVDASKVTSSNVEWFIEAPPPPANNCNGVCELNVYERIFRKQGQVQVEINKEANGARVRVSATADTSADYIPPAASGGTRPDEADRNAHYGVKNPTIYQAEFGVHWQPKQPALQIEPGTIQAGDPTNIIVSAHDRATGNPVSGRILINNTEVGVTNAPFEYRFLSKNYGTAKVIAAGYSDTPIYFSISSPLEVGAEPRTVSIGTETLITIHAVNPVTHEPVVGKVLTQEGLQLLREREIGDTNTPFRHTFQPVPNVVECSGAITYSYPEVFVEASGYDTAKVSIDFTGSLPEGDPGDPTLCIRPDGDDIEDGDDNCPGPRSCPIDDVPNREPFDIP